MSDAQSSQRGEIVAAAIKGGKKPPLFRQLFEKFSALLLASAIILFWQIYVQVSGVTEFVLPAPTAIAERLILDFPLLISHAVITFSEVIAGFGSAVIIGLPMALIIFYSPIFERSIYPILIALQTVPKIVLAPLLVLYLGYGWAPKIVLAFLISFFPILISSVIGLQSLDKELVNMVRSMGAKEYQIFQKLRLPAALPNVFGGFKVAIYLAVIGAVIGEYVAAEQGLGYLQLQANSQFDTTLNFATVIMISAIGVCLYLILNALGKRISFRRDSAI
ncbi:MAG: ABC transporter permease [Pseudomonadota bacterium]|nr:ABC transporter permease [Pseudomonadota bacterium]